MIDLLSQGAHKDIVLDRTHYGELIWPQVYGRKALLDEEQIDILREVEDSVGVQRIWMTDDNLTAHWQRCVDNKEPLDKAQFTRARGLYSSLAQKYGFEKVTLQTFVKQFPDAQSIIDQNKASELESKTLQVTTSGSNTTVTEVDTTKPISSTNSKYPSKTPQQHKLEVANAINEILSKRILKTKNSVYDDIENELRNFLNTKLGKLLGGSDSNELQLTQDEIKFYKAMYVRAQSKV